MQLSNFLIKKGIKFKNLNFYQRAFTHSTYVNENMDFVDYEKMEFFGDAIIGFVVAKYVYLQNLKTPVSLGKLSKIKHFLVSEKVLNQVARSLHLAEVILSSDELKKKQFSSAILSDVFESLVAALYLDLGFTFTENFIIQHLVKPFFQKALDNVDYSSTLQEVAQKETKKLPIYSFQKQGKEFLAFCQYKNYQTSAKAKNKKLASKEAAFLMLKKLKKL